jgi:hypothetical protein
MPHLRILMITKNVDLDDDVLGFTHTWVNKLAERVAWLHVLALAVGRRELRENVTLYSMGKERGVGRLRCFVKFAHIVASLVLRRQVVEHYQQTDLFVNLSYTDGLDKAVL